MLTRLKVTGFKNLLDVDVRFGSFTCIAGANGVGKSNLFDAIRFLSLLADRSFTEAAVSIRADEDYSGERRSGDLRYIFHHVGDRFDDEMLFEAEMIVPSEGRDDFGQEAKAAITFLRYSLTLKYRKEESFQSGGSVELLKEDLTQINIGEAKKHLLFKHHPTWFKSAIRGRRSTPFISTEGTDTDRVIKLHQDGGPGRALSLSAPQLPRTVLSRANAAEHPTALLARREMQSWRQILFEPSSLRRPDDIKSPAKLGADGSHLAATLYRLARSNGVSPSTTEEARDIVAAQVYGRMANRLAELVDDVREVTVDYDPKRELLTLLVTGRDGTPHPARSLSDGTLRFLALSVLELDTQAQGVLCLEEPENGIHPERLPSMLRLLQDIATDVNEPLGPDNPLRQIIINTHSPAVVLQVPDDSILVAELREKIRRGHRFKGVQFSCLPDTWRALKEPATAVIVSKGRLLAYLNPVVPQADDLSPQTNEQKATQMIRRPCRVIDRPDLQMLLFPHKPQ